MPGHLWAQPTRRGGPLILEEWSLLASAWSLRGPEPTQRPRPAGQRQVPLLAGGAEPSPSGPAPDLGPGAAQARDADVRGPGRTRVS